MSNQHSQFGLLGGSEMAKLPKRKMKIVYLFALTAFILAIFGLNQRVDGIGRGWTKTFSRIKVEAEETVPSVIARIIKVTVFYDKGMLYKGAEEDVSSQILTGHTQHAERHGHRQVIQRQNLMGGIYTKPAAILNLILQELKQPVEKRAEWIFWHDADTVIMNPSIDLATFLPPTLFDDEAYLLATNDQNGLNNGVFFIKVNTWAVELLSGILGMSKLSREDFHLQHDDQGAMEYLITKVPYFKSKTTILPRRWMNAYVLDKDSTRFKPGYLLVHAVAGSKIKLPDYVHTANQHLPQYEIPPEKSGLLDDVSTFWEGGYEANSLW